MNDSERMAWKGLVGTCGDGSQRVTINTHSSIILAADAALTRLSALEERCGDVEGMAKAIWSNLQDQEADAAPMYIARAVSRWLLGKEGK